MSRGLIGGIVCVWLCVIECGCATQGMSAASASAMREVEIQYALNHNRYYLLFKEENVTVVSPKAKARFELDGQLLREGHFERSRFMAFYDRAEKFVDANITALQTSRKPAVSASCRNPYTIAIKVGADAKTTQGCRVGEEDTGVGKLIREAEFMLYSDAKSTQK